MLVLLLHLLERYLVTRLDELAGIWLLPLVLITLKHSVVNEVFYLSYIQQVFVCLRLLELQRGIIAAYMAYATGEVKLVV